MTDPMITVAPQPVSTAPSHEGTAMLLHEALARSRMQELERAAREFELVRKATAGRRWDRLARFAARRADRARAATARMTARQV